MPIINSGTRNIPASTTQPILNAVLEDIDEGTDISALLSKPGSPLKNKDLDDSQFISDINNDILDGGGNFAEVRESEAPSSTKRELQLAIQKNEEQPVWP